MLSLPAFKYSSVRLWVYVLSCAAAVIAASFTGSQFLHSWDSVNFALGVERIDVGAHRPHPPGYLAFIACARALGAISSAPTALVIVSAVAAAISCLVIWEMARATTRSDAAALVAWSVAVSSPLLWFYASTAEIYALELLSTVVCAGSASVSLRRPASVMAAMGMGAALGLAVLVKPSAAVLMMPLWLYTATRLSGKVRWWAVASGVAGVAIGSAILVSVVPARDLLSLTHSQLSDTVSADARFDPLHLMNRRVRDVLYALCAALGVGGGVALAWRRKAVAPFTDVATLVVWGVPYLAMCIGLHFPKPGYVLPLIAPMALWVASRSTARSTRESVMVAIVVAALNAGQFALRPWDASATGGDKRYALKTPLEKLATEANAVLRPSRATIENVDASVARLVASIPEACVGRPAALLVETGGQVTWRHAMYYLREPVVLQIGRRTDETLAAWRGEGLASLATPQSRTVECVGLVSQGRLGLRGDAIVQRAFPGGTIYWSSGLSTVTWSTTDGVVVSGATAPAIDGSKEPAASR